MFLLKHPLRHSAYLHTCAVWYGGDYSAVYHYNIGNSDLNSPFTV